ncbi:hypothetical protein BT69DRAFT_824623 [Atractiella rhizophila]|nr:hypothetical protein BT69DRAFT_824623 [Atractiella rhizophila]
MLHEPNCCIWALESLPLFFFFFFFVFFFFFFFFSRPPGTPHWGAFPLGLHPNQPCRSRQLLANELCGKVHDLLKEAEQKHFMFLGNIGGDRRGTDRRLKRKNYRSASQ